MDAIKKIFGGLIAVVGAIGLCIPFLLMLKDEGLGGMGGALIGALFFIPIIALIIYFAKKNGDWDRMG